MLRTIFLLLASLILANAQDVSGIRGLIESCSGCALNRLPQLKAFLKEPGGVDQYKNVEVNFISGRKAVLTIFKDGKEQEKVTLSDYDNRDQLTSLFVQKGFERYNKEELAARSLKAVEENARPGPPAAGVRGSRRESKTAMMADRQQQQMMARKEQISNQALNLQKKGEDLKEVLKNPALPKEKRDQLEEILRKLMLAKDNLGGAEERAARGETPGPTGGVRGAGGSMADLKKLNKEKLKKLKAARENFMVVGAPRG